MKPRILLALVVAAALAPAALADPKKPLKDYQLQNSLDANGQQISNLPAPVSANDAARKAYADTKLSLGGGTMTGALLLPPAAPTNANQAVAKGYVDEKFGMAVWSAGANRFAADHTAWRPGQVVCEDGPYADNGMYVILTTDFASPSAYAYLGRRTIGGAVVTAATTGMMTLAGAAGYGHDSTRELTITIDGVQTYHSGAGMGFDIDVIEGQHVAISQGDNDSTGQVGVSGVSATNVSRVALDSALPSALTYVAFSGALTNPSDIDISVAPNLNQVDLSYNSLSSAAVSAILNALVANGVTGGSLILYGGDNAAPSGPADEAAIATLTDRGWSIITN